MGPHRVIFKGDSRFWGRSTNGKYELDVPELRNAFLFSNAVNERMAAFRSDRIIALENGRSLVTVAPGPKLAIHCMALESFGGRPHFDVLALDQFRPIGTSLAGWRQPRVNFEGIICVASGNVPISYTQVFRNGVVEAVHAGVLSNPIQPRFIPGLAYEETVVNYLPHCFQIIRKLGCRPPVFIGISLIGVRGLTLWIGPLRQIKMGGGTLIDRDVLILPEILVEDLSAPVGPLLKPTLDLVWNACGFEHSIFFDDAGNWVGRH